MVKEAESNSLRWESVESQVPKKEIVLRSGKVLDAIEKLASEKLHLDQTVRWSLAIKEKAVSLLW